MQLQGFSKSSVRPSVVIGENCRTSAHGWTADLCFAIGPFSVCLRSTYTHTHTHTYIYVYNTCIHTYLRGPTHVLTCPLTYRRGSEYTRAFIHAHIHTNTHTLACIHTYMLSQTPASRYCGRRILYCDCLLKINNSCYAFRGEISRALYARMNCNILRFTCTCSEWCVMAVKLAPWGWSTVFFLCLSRHRST
jgi:hypothetical protein